VFEGLPAFRGQNLFNERVSRPSGTVGTGEVPCRWFIIRHILREQVPSGRVMEMQAIRWKSVIVLLSGVLLAACGPGEEAEPGSAVENVTDSGGAVLPAAARPEEAVERARSAADALASEMMGKLVRELSENGPAGAFNVCADIAQEISASHSKDGLLIRRVSLRIRNPQDEPDDYERRVLEEMEALQQDGGSPVEKVDVVTEGGEDRLRYMRPLTIKKPCLACHGDVAAMDGDVRALLAERYPDDRAVGYGEGDLRGAISVVVQLDSATINE
jgi:hypothetical protein